MGISLLIIRKCWNFWQWNVRSISNIRSVLLKRFKTNKLNPSCLSLVTRCGTYSPTFLLSIPKTRLFFVFSPVYWARLWASTHMKYFPFLKINNCNSWCTRLARGDSCSCYSIMARSKRVMRTDGKVSSARLVVG